MNQELKIVPFFPLGIFLFPGEDIPLRIFEPRYKQLIDEAKEDGFTFAIPFVIDSVIQSFGCEVRLKEIVAENPKGRMVITIESLAVVNINTFNLQLKGKLYSGGAISTLPEPSHIRSIELNHLITNYSEHFDHDFLSCCSNDIVTHYDVAAALNLPSEEKYRFITLDTDEERERFLISQVRYLMVLRNQEELLDNDFGLN